MNTTFITLNEINYDKAFKEVVQRLQNEGKRGYVKFLQCEVLIDENNELEVTYTYELFNIGLK
jgi:hypothetical protein